NLDRSKSRSSTSDNSEIAVELAYLDYGNNEEGHITELRPLDPAFIRLPAQAIYTALE
ncbi:unnamed protein product, partial [Rotaria magnacalcarata]